MFSNQISVGMFQNVTYVRLAGENWVKTVILSKLIQILGIMWDKVSLQVLLFL